MYYLQLNKGQGPFEVYVDFEEVSSLKDVKILKINGSELSSKEFSEYKQNLIEYIIYKQKSHIFYSTTKNRDFLYKNFLKYLEPVEIKTDFIINPWYLLKSVISKEYTKTIINANNKALSTKQIKEICDSLKYDEIMLLSIAYTQPNLILLSRDLLRTIRKQNRKYLKASEYIHMLENDQNIKQDALNLYIKRNGIESMRNSQANIRSMNSDKYPNNKQELFNILKIRSKYLIKLTDSKSNLFLNLSIGIKTQVELKTLIAMYSINKEKISTYDILTKLGMTYSNHKNYKNALVKLTKYYVNTSNNKTLCLVEELDSKKNNTIYYRLNKECIGHIEEQGCKLLNDETK